MPEDGFPVIVAGEVPVVTAAEEIDVTNAGELRSALLQASSTGASTLVVDMTQTQFCDSSGLHAVLAAHRQAQAQGREVMLVVPNPAVLRIFALTGTDTLFPIYASLDQALASAAAANGHNRQPD